MSHRTVYFALMRPGACSLSACFAWLIAASLASTSLAQDIIDADAAVEDAISRYQVEVIVFAHEDFDPGEELLDANLLSEEPLEPPPIPEKKYFDALSRLEVLKQVEAPILPDGGEPRQLPPFSDDLLAIETFADGGPSAANFRVLERDELQLIDAYRRIDRLSAYTPLLHGGWSQNSIDEENAVPFDLARLGGRSDLGTIRLHVSRFLHVTVDLQYRPLHARPPLVAAPVADSGFRNEFRDFSPVYKLHAERRILRGELNYIDHPAFGLVVLITLEPEPEDAESDEVDPARPAA